MLRWKEKLRSYLDAARFDEKIERDAKSGKLDRLTEQALADYRAGRARELFGRVG